MMPVAPCSPSNTSFVLGTTFTVRKYRSFSSQRLFITLPKTTTLFPQLRNGHPSLHLSKFQSVSSIGTDVAVEVHEITASDEAVTQGGETNGEASADVSSTNGEASGESEVSNARNGEVSAESDVSNTPIMAKKRRGRKSEMPPVQIEDLIPGAIFTGKIRSVQPFGAFVDFGAFTDGLVHVSRLSDNFVKDVNDVVSLGQEVKVRLVEANTETGRISLSMRDNDVSNDSQKNTDKPRSPRKTASMEGGVQKKEFKKTSKFVKGQDFVGTVKNFGRSGAFISLPEDEEGFLPTSEEPDDGFGNIMGQTSLEMGQEVKVRVLRIARGIITLTMKKEEDVGKLESKLNQGVVHTATNPFFIAFRRNKDIAAFLDDRDKIVGIDETVKQANSNNSEEMSVSNVVSNVESESLDGVSLITKEEIQTESSTDSTEEVVKEIPVIEAIGEIPIPEEGNGIITSSIEEEN